MVAIVIVTHGKKKSIWRVVCVGVALLLSLLSKEAGVLFVLFCALLAMRKRLLGQYLPAFVLPFAIYLAARMYASKHVLFNTVANQFGALDLGHRLFLVPQVAYALMRETFIPTRIAIMPGAFRANFASSLFPLAMLVFFWGGAVVLWLFVTRRSKKLASQLLFFLGWTVLGILPYVQIVPLDVAFASRWLYVSAIGTLGIIGVLMNVFRLKRSKLVILGCILIGSILFLYGLETFILNLKWHDWERNFVYVEEFKETQ